MLALWSNQAMQIAVFLRFVSKSFHLVPTQYQHKHCAGLQGMRPATQLPGIMTGLSNMIWSIKKYVEGQTLLV